MISLSYLYPIRTEVTRTRSVAEPLFANLVYALLVVAMRKDGLITDVETTLARTRTVSSLNDSKEHRGVP